MRRDEVKEALRGRLQCMHAAERMCNYAGPRDDRFMSSSSGGICRIANDVAGGSSCSGCLHRCGDWFRKLLACRDDGEAREVLVQACAGWTPPPPLTNRIPREAEP